MHITFIVIAVLFVAHTTTHTTAAPMLGFMSSWWPDDSQSETDLEKGDGMQRPQAILMHKDPMGPASQPMSTSTTERGNAPEVQAPGFLQQLYNLIPDLSWVEGENIENPYAGPELHNIVTDKQEPLAPRVVLRPIDHDRDCTPVVNRMRIYHVQGLEHLGAGNTLLFQLARTGNADLVIQAKSQFNQASEFFLMAYSMNEHMSHGFKYKLRKLRYTSFMARAKYGMKWLVRAEVIGKRAQGVASWLGNVKRKVTKFLFEEREQDRINLGKVAQSGALAAKDELNKEKGVMNQCHSNQ